MSSTGTAILTAVILTTAITTTTPTALASEAYPLVSVNSRESGSNGHSSFGEVSRTGRYVLFESLGTNLSNRDLEGDHPDVFLRDRREGTTRLVSLSSAERAAQAAWAPSISPSGRFVAFCSTDPRLQRPDSYDFSLETMHPDTDVFVRDLRSGVTRRASTTRRGTEGNDWSCDPSVADTGDVAFVSSATNLVPRDRNRAQDVFLFDWSGRTIRRLSGGGSGGTEPKVSGDGRFVAFYTGSALVAGDTNRLAEMYVYRRPSSSYERATRKASGRQVTRGCDPVGVDLSYTGRYLLASCRDGAMAQPAVPDKTSHLWRIDRRNRTNILLNPTPLEHSAVWGAAVTDDGSRVVFSARPGPYGSVPADDTYDNLYLWQRGAGLQMLTPGDLSWWWNFTQEISGNGRVVLFSSDSAYMSLEDRNDPQQVDLFLKLLP